MCVEGDKSYAGPLAGAVAQLCESLSAQVPQASAPRLRAIGERLASPLQLAVVGRIKAGKSTLVNALIGRRVAQTGIGECTRLVTRYRYGTVDRIDVVRLDGSRMTLPPGAQGGLPTELGIDPAQVSHLEAYLTNAVLRDLTVIDTPGLGSTDESSARRAEAVLGIPSNPAAGTGPEPALDEASTRAITGAEALLYVLTQDVRATDQDSLAAFHAAGAHRDAGPVTALAVLNKVDTVPPDSLACAEGDLAGMARVLAARQEAALGSRVAGVLPMIGLLAETTETGAFTAEIADGLRELS
ncbi:MAG: dynamin family protein, partial [Sciscionella sp.]